MLTVLVIRDGNSGNFVFVLVLSFSQVQSHERVVSQFAHFQCLIVTNSIFPTVPTRSILGFHL